MPLQWRYESYFTVHRMVNLTSLVLCTVVWWDNKISETASWLDFCQFQEDFRWILAPHHTEQGPPLSFYRDSREMLNSARSERWLAVKQFFCVSEVGSFAPTALPLFPGAHSEVCYVAPIPVLHTMVKFGLTAAGKPMSSTSNRIFWPMLHSLNFGTFLWKRQNPHWRSQQYLWRQNHVSHLFVVEGNHAQLLKQGQITSLWASFVGLL